MEERAAASQKIAHAYRAYLVVSGANPHAMKRALINTSVEANHKRNT